MKLNQVLILMFLFIGVFRNPASIVSMYVDVSRSGLVWCDEGNGIIRNKYNLLNFQLTILLQLY